jgi:hypothetical protein
MAPQPTWWHELTIVIIVRVVVLNMVAIVGLAVAQRIAAHLIDGHTPAWGSVGNACYAFGLVVTEAVAAVILVRAPAAD